MIKQTGFIELVGTDEQVDQDEWGASVQVPFAPESQSICIPALILRQGFDGSATGASLSIGGFVVFFFGDPSIAVGTGVGALTRAQLNKIVGWFDIAAQGADWQNWRAAGAADDADIAFLQSEDDRIQVPRMAGEDLYAALLLTSATSINSAAGDDEDVYMKVIYET